MFTNICRRLVNYLFYFVYGSCLLHLGYLIATRGFFKTQVFVLLAIFVLLSFVMYFMGKVSFIIDFLAWMGSISYALYIIHSPILYAFERVPLFGGYISNFYSSSCYCNSNSDLCLLPFGEKITAVGEESGRLVDHVK